MSNAPVQRRTQRSEGGEGGWKQPPDPSWDKANFIKEENGWTPMDENEECLAYITLCVYIGWRWVGSCVVQGYT